MVLAAQFLAERDRLDAPHGSPSLFVVAKVLNASTFGGTICLSFFPSPSWVKKFGRGHFSHAFLRIFWQSMSCRNPPVSGIEWFPSRVLYCSVGLFGEALSLTDVVLILFWFHLWSRKTSEDWNILLGQKRFHHKQWAERQRLRWDQGSCSWSSGRLRQYNKRRKEEENENQSLWNLKLMCGIWMKWWSRQSLQAVSFLLSTLFLSSLLPRMFQLSLRPKNGGRVNFWDCHLSHSIVASSLLLNAAHNVQRRRCQQFEG